MSNNNDEIKEWIDSTSNHNATSTLKARPSSPALRSDEPDKSRNAGKPTQYAIYRDGQLLVEDSFSEIRKRIIS